MSFSHGPEEKKIQELAQNVVGKESLHTKQVTFDSIVCVQHKYMEARGGFFLFLLISCAQVSFVFVRRQKKTRKDARKFGEPDNLKCCFNFLFAGENEADFRSFRRHQGSLVCHPGLHKVEFQ